MKKLLVSALIGLSFGAAAQETGRVISSTPVVQQVTVQRQVCSQQTVQAQPQPSGAGGLMGALAGAALGSSIGGGDGRIAATVIGTVGGALLGNSIESSQAAGRTQLVQNCTPQTFTESRTVGYDVTYEYAGKQYTARMPNDPGPTVQLSVTPVGAGARPSGGSAPLVTAPPIAQADGAVVAPAPQPVIVTQPLHTVVYPSYTYAPYYWYPPISFSFGYVHRHRHWHHHGHWRHRHWR